MNLLESLFSRKNEPGARRRVPLFVRITITLLAILALLYFVIGGVFLSLYKESLAYGELNKGWLTLNHLSSAARTNLLEEDSLSLSVLTADYAAADAVLYTTVVDHTQSILAHSDPSQVGSKYSPADRISETIQDPEFTTYERLVAGQRAYELSQTLRFQDKFLGTAYLGLSQNYIND